MAHLRLVLRCLRPVALMLSAVGAMAASAAPACTSRSGPLAPTVVELYTSEGCSSCPPAERWLSALEGRDGVVALAFHVDYWDGLGWKDRFAQPQFTQRQNASQRTSGAHFAYTPQVLLDSRDAPDWPTRATPSPTGRRPATVELQLERDATGLALTVTPGAGAPGSLAGYVAVVDDGLQTHVAAGENRGATLRQDAVVRELLPWSLAGHHAATLRFQPTVPAEPGVARHWVAVATDGPFGTPVQALALVCER